MSDEPTPGPLDDATLAKLLEASLPALRAYVRTRVGPALMAQESTSDIVQSVCRELLVDRAEFEFRNEAAFRGWLFTAALHKIHQHDRYWQADRRAAAREVPADAADGELVAGYAHLFTPSRAVAANEEIGRLEAALAQLSDADRELIALARIAGLPHSEIAAHTGRSEEACRQGLRRALVRLAALLEPGGQG